MFFQIEPNNGQPIYSQIVRQVKYAIAEKTLRPGELLPSVRHLSTQLAINPNTVARAFQQLQSEGLIETLRGRGVVVTESATSACRKQRREMIGTRIEEVIVEALRGGLSGDDIRKIVDRKISALEGKVVTAGAATG